VIAWGVTAEGGHALHTVASSVRSLLGPEAGIDEGRKVGAEVVAGRKVT
jgi:hypothetical protein